MQKRTLPPEWQAYALFVGMPVWWLLGLSHFIWPVLAVPMLLSLLLRHDRIRIPPTFGIWLLLVAWMLASATQIDTSGRALGFALRFSLYLSAGLVFLFLYNAPWARESSSALVRALAVYFIVVVAGGFLGMLFPNFSYRTPAAHFMPGSLASNDYVGDLVTARFAEVNDFLGYPVGRPAAFFTYTNGWGSNFAILLPFAIALIFTCRSRRTRTVLASVVLASIVPAIASLNRGLWLSTAVGLVYVVGRLAARRRAKPLVMAIAYTCVAVLVIAFSPLKATISQRLAHQQSNAARRALYHETFDRAVHSPLVGYGTPRPAESGSYLDSVGTQGQLLYLVFSHGFPALIFFLVWIACIVGRSRRATSPYGMAAHVSIVIALVQIPIYGMTLQLFVIMAAAVVALAESTSKALASRGDTF